MIFKKFKPIVPERSEENIAFLRIVDFFNNCLYYIHRDQQHPYDKIDSKEFNFVSQFIRQSNQANDTSGLISTIKLCRDYLLNKDYNCRKLQRLLTDTQQKICEYLETPELGAIRKSRQDIGMSKRYNHLSKKLKKVVVKRMGMGLIYTDLGSGSAKENYLIRRIVEKRSAQAADKHREFRNRGEAKHAEKRALSFSIRNLKYKDYNVEDRCKGTHWKVVYNYGDNGIILRSKNSYGSIEEAMEVCRRYQKSHPDDKYPMTPYLCKHCGKWHIGHDRNREEDIDVLVEMPKVSKNLVADKMTNDFFAMRK